MALTGESYKGNMALCRNNTPGSTNEHPCDPMRGEDFYYFQTDYDEGKASDLVSYVNYTQGPDEQQPYSGEQGTVYTFKPVRPESKKAMNKEEVKVSPTGLGIEMEGQGGVYVLLVTGTKQKVTF
uniref:Uncharacterized protein n=1 Tax=Ditylenchus dipsaci TaxID=166011 RepID=A0A915CWA6_9BILA